jgi:hypothetical protein
LENHHCAFAYELLADNQYKFAPGLAGEPWAEMREKVITMVLGTDMFLHFAELGRFKTKCNDANVTFPAPNSKTDKLLCMKIMLHACDISNPSKALSIALDWTQRILTEYFRQGDLERDAGRPPSMFMDRHTTNIASNQLGFIDIIVYPLFEALNTIFPAVEQHILDQMAENRQWWDERVATMQQSLQNGGNNGEKVWLPSPDDDVRKAERSSSLTGSLTMDAVDSAEEVNDQCK